MDRTWSRPSTIPEKLYRVICPNQNTYYDPTNGLLAALNLPSQCFIARHRLPAFFRSITHHRDQHRVPSPWISLYESLSEAEMFCIAASDYHQSNEKCFIIEIDLTHYSMQKISLYYVHDIQVMCPPGVQLGVGPPDNGTMKGGRWDSEWLALYAVPGGRAMRVLKDGRECRIDQNWQGINELAIYAPPKLANGAIQDQKEWLKVPIVETWEQCGTCESHETCTHLGGFRMLSKGAKFTSRLRRTMAEEVEKARDRNKQKFEEAAEKRVSDEIVYDA